MIRISGKKIDVELLKKRVQILKSTSRTLRKLAREPAPTNLSPEQKKELGKYNKWLEHSSSEIDELAGMVEDMLGESDKLMQGTKAMQEINQSFNLQYLQLQQDMQAQNRQFTMISNIMKVKHDTAKSAINNVR